MATSGSVRARRAARLKWLLTGWETMALEEDKTNQIALNVTRTRVTVLVFNLTIIAFMFSILKALAAGTDNHIAAHLTSSIALFAGFCLTLLGLLLLLASQNLDSEGLSRPFLFTLGSIVTYLALSQTITAFMHEYLLAIQSTVAASQPGDTGYVQNAVRVHDLSDLALLILFAMGGGVWIAITYGGPLHGILRAPLRVNRRWVLLGCYFALQIPIYWVSARAWQLQYAPAEQSVNIGGLFALQFVQPLLWLR